MYYYLCNLEAVIHLMFSVVLWNIWLFFYYYYSIKVTVCLLLHLLSCISGHIPAWSAWNRVLCADQSLCGVSVVPAPSVFALELSLGLVSLCAVDKEMLIWIACRGQCRGCRSDSYPSPWSSLPVNIITPRWKRTRPQRARTRTHPHKLLIQIGANRLAVIINKHGGLILCALSLLYHWASQGNYQVLDCKCNRTHTQTRVDAYTR